MGLNEGTCQWLSGVTGVYRWLEGVQFIEFMTFNVESEFLSLFVHGFKQAETQDDLVVANLALRQQPGVAIYCKTPPKPIGQTGDEEACGRHAKREGMSDG